MQQHSEPSIALQSLKMSCVGLCSPSSYISIKELYDYKLLLKQIFVLHRIGNGMSYIRSEGLVHNDQSLKHHV